jgi:hypothetical protein
MEDDFFMSKFKPVGVLTKSSSGKTLRLEVHFFGEAVSATYMYVYVYPRATRDVIEGRKKSATVYAVFEEKRVSHATVS